MASKPAEVFPLSEYLEDEMKSRGWTREDLAEKMGRPLRQVNDLLKGKRPLMPKMAMAIEKATGVSAETWTNLDRAYREWKNCG